MGVSVLVSAVVLSFAASADAAPILIGSGDDHVNLLVQFSEGTLYEFDVAFTDGDAFNGLNVLDVVEAAGIGFSTVRVFGGAFIDGISYDGHNDSGFGGGEDWWHYWYLEPGDADWTSSFVGAGDRVMHDGYTEGWVYGFATVPGAPTPEPATVGLMIVSALAFVCRRNHTGA